MHPITRAAYLIAGHAATLASAIAPKGGRKVLRSLAARRGGLDEWEAWGRTRRDPARPLAWFHAPSVGEGLQARPVIDLIRARRPEWQVAYTYFSPSAESFAAKLPVDVAGYLPFDTPRQGQRLVAALQPSALVFAKLDVWPLLCEAAHGAGVPLGMVSGTVSRGSRRRGGLARALTRDAYALLDGVGAISDDDARRLVELGCRPASVTVTGDTRYDQVWARARGVDRAQGLVGALGSPRPTIVAGSTWPSDEAVVLPAFLATCERVPRARLIIAPHEPTDAHLRPIERWGEASGVDLARLGAPDVGDADVVLVDRVGVLGDLYALGTCAFVGGGFHAAGLHSVLEPAAFGIPVMFGPKHEKSRDAGLLLEQDGGASVRGVAELADAMTRWLGPGAAIAGDHARTVVQDGLGAAERAFDLVSRLVDPGEN
ncbi:MAG: hypothetical protein IT361_15045 [Gemmatimonadaceae bacterium]|nr:hypothetical protein [Gemmatimonadaceae bacterium]